MKTAQAKRVATDVCACVPSSLLASRPAVSSSALPVDLCPTASRPNAVSHLLARQLHARRRGVQANRRAGVLILARVAVDSGRESRYKPVPALAWR